VDFLLGIVSGFLQIGERAIGYEIGLSSTFTIVSGSLKWLLEMKQISVKRIIFAVPGVVVKKFDLQLVHSIV